MKYKILNQTDTHIELFVLYDDNTYSNINLIGGRPIEEVLKDAYILTSNTTNRLPYTKETPTDLEVYDVTPVATTLKADFNNLTGKVYDQYGLKIDLPIEFSIEGTSARIENGKIVKDVVDNDTSYFIVAKCGDLEERQERTIYAPREANPIEGVNEETLQRITDLEELVKAQATTITNQAIAINKDRELLDTVDNDLNALVGGSDE